MKKLHRPFVATIACLALTVAFVSCSHAPPRAPGDLPTLVFDESNPEFFSTPFPADARKTAAGHFDVSAVPNPGNVGFVSASKELIATEVDGADPSAAISFRFDRPLGIPNDVVLDTLGDVPGVWLVDIDPTSPEYRTRIPALVRVTSHHDEVRPAHLLQVLPAPGRGGFEGKIHAVFILRDVDGDGREDLGASTATQRLLAREGEGKWHDSFQPLRAALSTFDVTALEVAAATVYTHGSPTARLFTWVQNALEAPAPMLAHPIVVEREYADYFVITGALEMPIYQEGVAPHFFGTGGRISVDTDGRPVVVRTEAAPFVVTVPKGQVASDGVPLYFYIHGTGGLASQAVDRGYRRSVDDIPAPGSGVASWVAPDGLATSCIAGPYSPERIGWRALDGYAAYMFFNPRAMRDNFAQMLLEQAHFLRFLDALELPTSTLPGVTTEGNVHVRLRPVLVGGQSLGSFLSGMFAALTARFQGAILTGAGGSWIEFGFGPKDPVDLAKLLDVIAAPKGERLDRFHPFISLFQTAVGAADNTHYTPYLVRRQSPVPSPRVTAPHVLIIEGQEDLQVATHLQRALVLSVGADLVGDDVGRHPNDRIAPALRFGGLKKLRAPVVENLTTPLGEQRTVGVMRFDEDGILEGHYVVFQRPDARNALVSFARAVAKGEVPTIAQTPKRAAITEPIVAPAGVLSR